uniref:Timm17a protein n=1 Tax=Rattus norvegicus TaxID=10116 RepID=Q6P6W9_RAT|nr:Timm17a protein [Rattus norvegicus]
MEEYAREPCPWRIVDDCGGAFTMGTIGGGIFQAFKGFRNSPVGVNHRLRGSLTAIKTRAPQLGGKRKVSIYTFHLYFCCFPEHGALSVCLLSLSLSLSSLVHRLNSTLELSASPS